MGAVPYQYFVKHQPDVSAALQDLRQREFRAGRYNPVIPFPCLTAGPNPPSPGAQHASIADAIRASGADGTRSILDLDRVAARPEFRAACPLAPGELQRLFGTTEPTRAMVERNPAFFEAIERGQGVYIVVYKDGRPDEIFFGGYSCD